MNKLSIFTGGNTSRTKNQEDLYGLLDELIFNFNQEKSINLFETIGVLHVLANNLQLKQYCLLDHMEDED